MLNDGFNFVRPEESHSLLCNLRTSEKVADSSFIRADSSFIRVSSLFYLYYRLDEV